MIPFTLVRKILVSLAPLALFYLLREVSREQHLPEEKSHLSGFDPSTRSTNAQAFSSEAQARRGHTEHAECATDLRASKSLIVEGEIVEEEK